MRIYTESIMYYSKKKDLVALSNIIDVDMPIQDGKNGQS